MRLALLAALCLSACDDDPAPGPPSTTPPTEAPAPSVAMPPPCAPSDPITVARGTAAPDAVGVAMGEERGLVVWTESETARAVAIGPDGEATGETVALPETTGALFAVGATNAGFVALFTERCDDGTCVTARHLAPDARVLPRVSRASFAAMWTRKQASTPSALVLAIGHENAPAEVLSFPFDADPVRTELPAPADTRTEVLGLTAEDAGWAALYRVGAAEGADSHVALGRSSALARGAEPLVLEALHDALAVESFASGPEGLAVIAAFEFSQPKHFVLSEDGVSGGQALGPHHVLPAPFEDRCRARARIDDGSLILDVETGVGYPVASVVPVRGVNPGAADVARLDAWTLIAAAARGEELVTTVVRCRL